MEYMILYNISDYSDKIILDKVFLILEPIWINLDQ